MTDIIISKYSNKSSTTCQEVRLVAELAAIQNGAHRQTIERCREALDRGDRLAYDNLKGNLPAATFSAIFNDRHKLECLKVYNQVMTIDIDKLELGRLDELRNRLQDDEYIYALWMSPSGKGIKGLIKTNAEMGLHKAYFSSISGYFKKKYDVEIDRSGSDITRLCFTSWDPDLFLNENSEIYKITRSQIPRDMPERKKDSGAKKTTSTSEKVIQIKKYERYKLFDTYGKNTRVSREQMAKVIKFLSKNVLSITFSYENWIKVSYAIANSFSFDLGEKYFITLCRLDREKHSEYKSKELLRYSYINKRDKGVRFGSIIFLAKKVGFKVRRKTKKETIGTM